MITRVPSPIQILFVDRLLRGKKGDTGPASSDGTVATHESMFDHGQLHSHENKGLLDFLSLENGNLAVNGMTVVDAALADPAIQDLVNTTADIVDNYHQRTLANIFLFTHDYRFAPWLMLNNLSEYNRFIAAGLIPPSDPNNGG